MQNSLTVAEFNPTRNIKSIPEIKFNDKLFTGQAR